MEVFSDAVGVQFYAGNFVESIPKGKEGVVYQKRSGLCLETQRIPGCNTSRDVSVYRTACRCKIRNDNHLLFFSSKIKIRYFIQGTGIYLKQVMVLKVKGVSAGEKDCKKTVFLTWMCIIGCNAPVLV